MNQSVTQQTGNHPDSKSLGFSEKCLYFLCLALLFYLLGSVLSPSWNKQSYYDYGWVVLPLAILFFLRRRVERISKPQALNPWLTGVLVASLLTLIPLRLIHEVDIFWRQPLWLMSFLILLSLHLMIARAEGWLVSCYCLPATLFSITSIPLPSFVESAMIQKLTEQVVHIGHQSLLLAGYPVQVVGNLLCAKGSMVDVTEGCSGIRSIQSSVMAGLALGELFRTTIAKRVILLIIAIVLAFVGNAARIFVLGRLAFESGIDAVNQAHDPVGFAVLCLVYGGVALIAWPLTQCGKPARQFVKRTEQKHE
jgi:exosortase